MLSKKIISKIRSINQDEIKSFENYIDEHNAELILKFNDLFQKDYDNCYSYSFWSEDDPKNKRCENSIIIHKKNEKIESLIPDELIEVLWLIKTPTDASISRMLTHETRRTLYTFKKIKKELIVKTVLEDPNRLSCIYYGLGQDKFNKVFNANLIRALDKIVDNHTFQRIDDLTSFALAYATLKYANLLVLRKLADKADNTCLSGLSIMSNYIEKNLQKELNMKGLEIASVLSKDEVDTIFTLKDVYKNNKHLTLLELSKINKKLLVFKKNYDQKELEELVDYNYTLLEEMNDLVIDEKLQLKIITLHPLYALKIKNITLNSWIHAIKQSPYMFRYCNRDDLPKETIEEVYNSYPEFDSNTSTLVFYNNYIFQQNTPSYILTGVEETIRNIGIGDALSVRQHKNYKSIANSLLSLLK